MIFHKYLSKYYLPVLCLLLCLAAFNGTYSYGQSTSEDVKNAIDAVEKGKADDAKKQLPDLLSKYPNTPGIIYLQGRLASDGIEAVKFYQSIVDNFPKSEWADDALFRIYQYYYSLGLYRTADLKMQQLKKEFPMSQYVTGKPEIKTPAEEEKPVKLPEKEIVAADTQQNVENAPPKIKPAEEPVPAPYTVQVGAFASRENAEKQKIYLDELGYQVEVTNKIRNGKSFFLVWVGSFKTMDEARLIVREIKQKHAIESMIVERY